MPLRPRGGAARGDPRQRPGRSLPADPRRHPDGPDGPAPRRGTPPSQDPRRPRAPDGALRGHAFRTGAGGRGRGPGRPPGAPAVPVRDRGDARDIRCGGPGGRRGQRMGAHRGLRVPRRPRDARPRGGGLGWRAGRGRCPRRRHVGHRLVRAVRLVRRVRVQHGPWRAAPGRGDRAQPAGGGRRAGRIGRGLARDPAAEEPPGDDRVESRPSGGARRRLRGLRAAFRAPVPPAPRRSSRVRADGRPGREPRGSSRSPRWGW